MSLVIKARNYWGDVERPSGCHASHSAPMYSMYVCMKKFIKCEFLQPKQSRVRTRRPYYKDVSLACYRMMSLWVLDLEVTMVKSSTVLGHRQRSCVVQKQKCCRLRLALANRHERQSVGGDDLYNCDRNTQLLEVLWCGLMATLEDDQAELENYPLWYWQPVKVITKCRCYSIELDLPHYESCSWVQNDWMVFVAVVLIC